MVVVMPVGLERRSGWAREEGCRKSDMDLSNDMEGKMVYRKRYGKCETIISSRGLHLDHLCHFILFTFIEHACNSLNGVKLH